MQIHAEPVRKTLTLLTWALIYSLGVAVPVLERSEIVAEPVAESAHDPATCPPAHDHSFCTQVGSELVASGARAPCDVTGAVSAPPSPPRVHRLQARTPRDTNPSRAPPRLT